MDYTYSLIVRERPCFAEVADFAIEAHRERWRVGRLKRLNWGDGVMGIFDRKQVFIGSLNVDPMALENNTEIGVVLKSAETAQRIGTWFDHTIETIAFRLELVTDESGYEQLRWHGMIDGEQRVFATEPYSGFWRRFGIDFLSILPIESLL